MRVRQRRDSASGGFSEMAQFNILERAVWGGNRLISVSPEDRRLHTYIVGKSGSGKTTLLRNFVVQQIAADEGVGVLDPHGDLAQELLEFIPPHRIDDVVYFDPTDEYHPCGLNVIRNDCKPDMVAAALVSALKSIWNDSWGPRLEYILYASVAALAECQNVTLLGIPRLLLDETYRDWVVRQVKDPVVRSFWKYEYTGYDKRFRNEATAPVLNKVGQFCMSPGIRNILGQVKNRIDFRFVMDNKRIFIANLSKGILGDERSALLGSLLVSQFQLAAMSRASLHPEERNDFSLAVDEFQAFATESFGSILSEARKYGLNLTLSHQYLAQLPQEIRDAVFGNVGSIITFQVGSDDASLLESQFAREITAEALVSLAKYEVAARIYINEEQAAPFIARTLPPLGKRFNCQDKIIARSRERFSTNQSVIAERLKHWMGE